MSEVKEQKKSTVSFSQYSVWANCPWQWKLENVDGFKADKTIHLIFGSAIHDVVQTWLKSVHDNIPLVDPLSTIFFNRLAELFKEHKSIDKDGKTVYICSREELTAFYTHGIAILRYIVLNAKKIFPEGWVLLGIELPLELDIRPNVKFRGYLDIVLKNPATGQIKIFDLKTSSKGWGRWQKTDSTKLGQLLLYKNFYSKMYKVPIDYVAVEFVILSRMPRFTKTVESFIPPSGRNEVQDITNKFMKFVDACYKDDGSKIVEQKATPSERNCKFCQFVWDKEKCPYSFYPPKKEFAV